VIYVTFLDLGCSFTRWTSLDHATSVHVTASWWSDISNAGSSFVMWHTRKKTHITMVVLRPHFSNPNEYPLPAASDSLVCLHSWWPGLPASAVTLSKSPTLPCWPLLFHEPNPRDRRNSTYLARFLPAPINFRPWWQQGWAFSIFILKSGFFENKIAF
jgi:hypothetical protein